MAQPRSSPQKPGSSQDFVATPADQTFAAVFETSQEALLIANAEGVIQQANPRARKLLGLASHPPGSLKLAHFFSASSGVQWASLSSAPDAPSPVDVSLANGLPARLILRSILPGSLHLLLYLEPLPPRSADSAQEESRLLQAELRSVLDSVQAGIVLFDSQGRIRYSNVRFAELFHLDSLQTEKLASFDDLAQAAAMRLRSPSALSVRWKSGNRESVEEELELAAPHSRVLKRLSRPVLDSHETAVGWLEVYSDVTEYRQIQSKMLQTEKMAALGQVVSGIAHELNNPLTSIMGYAQLLLGHGLAASQLVQARNVYQEAERARRIVKNLLYFARENKPERTAVDLNEIVERTLALRSYELKVEGIAIHSNLAPDLPHTMADPYQLQQVMLNLLMNAEQALQENPGGGHVSVRTRVLKSSSGPRISLEVSDDGPGIPREIVARIFDPFFTTKAAGVGTGLGLSIVYGIVRQHDGDVSFENQPAGGAKFSIELPVISVPAAEPRVQHTIAAPSPHAASGRILVIEDEPTVARLITDILQEDGHRVEAVLDSREGLARLSKNSFDLILCDLRMPGLDGRGFYQSLVRSGNPMQHKILFITGDTLSPATLEFLEPTRRPYLAKPFLVEELKSAVSQQLDAGRNAEENSPQPLAQRTHPGE